MQALTIGVDAAVIALAAVLGWTSQSAASSLVAERPVLPAPAAAGVAMVMAATALLANCGIVLLPSAVLGWFLLTLTLVDLATFRLPDGLTLPLIGIGLAFAAVGLVGPAPALGFAWPNVIDRAIGALGGYGAFAAVALLYRRARGRDGLGMGDAKLAAAGGAWIGALELPTSILVACGLAFAWVAIRWLRQGRETLQHPLPLGPPLAAAIWICWLTSLGGYRLAVG